MLRCHGIGIEIKNDCPFIMPNACVPVCYGRGGVGVEEVQ